MFEVLFRFFYRFRYVWSSLEILDDQEMNVSVVTQYFQRSRCDLSSLQELPKGQEVPNIYKEAYNVFYLYIMF